MLSTNIRKYREEKGLTQDELCKMLNKSKGVVSKWEKGENKPDADTIGKICSILDITPNILMGWSDNKIIKSESSNIDNDIITLYNKLDEIDKAEIRGEIKGLLKCEKYKQEQLKKKII